MSKIIKIEMADESMRVDYFVLTLRYDKCTGIMSAGLKDSVNRFIEVLRRSGFFFEYLRLVEPTTQAIMVSIFHQERCVSV